MQINRLSLGLQEELKTASNFNTARSESLFRFQAANAMGAGQTNQAPNESKKEEVDFSSLDVKDLNITGKQIEKLLNGFSDEVIKVFSSDLALDNPLRNKENQGQASFTA